MNEKLWNRKYIFLIIAYTLSSFSFYMITTLLTTYLVGAGVELGAAGVIVGLFSVTSLIIRPFTGYASDHFNKKWILIIGMLLIAGAIYGYVCTASIPIITLLRIVHGVCFALISTAIISLGSEFIPKDRMNAGIGYLGLSLIIASAVGPGMGTWIMDQFGVRYSFIAAAVFSLISMGLMLTFRYSYTPKKEKFKFSLDSILCPEAWNYSTIGAIYSFSNGVIASFIVLYALQKDIGNVSIYFTVCAVFLFAIRPVTARFADKVDIKYIVYPGLCLSALSMILLGTANTLAAILVSAVIRSIAQGAVQPILQAECIKAAGPERSGVATSTFYLGSDVGQGVGPIVAGVVAGAMGYSWAFFMCAGMFVLAGLIFAFGRKKA